MHRFVVEGRLVGHNAYIRIAKGKAGYRFANVKKKEEEAKVIRGINSAGLAGIENNLKYPLTFKFKWIEPNRKRDLDNITSSMKFIFDAMTKANVIVDDRWKYVAGFSHEFSVDKDNPRVIVEIYENGEE